MATSSPPSPLYDHDDHGMHAHYPYQYTLSGTYSASPTSYEPCEASYYYASAEPAAANALEHAHDASAVRLAYDQVPAHTYYGDAGGPVPYAGDYIPAHWHKGGGVYGGAPPLPACFESGEVSPASTDDSSGSFYGSPHAADARLVDERGCGAPPPAPAPAPLAGYGYHAHPGAAAAGYPRAVITAEQYSYPDGGALHYAEYDAHGFGAHAAGPLDSDAPHAAYAAAPPPPPPSPPPARRPSPMAHLPYPAEPAPYAFYGAYAPYGAAAVAQPQPVYAAGARAHGGAYAEATIAIPARRSPPLVEDTPKKPLTLACYFCRKRKIACGSPPPGRKDRTCNQCARRNLRCEYPVNSRRGTRQREAEASLYSTAAGYGG